MLRQALEAYLLDRHPLLRHARRFYLKGLVALLLGAVVPDVLVAQERVIQSNVSGETLARICMVQRDLELDPCVAFILGVADGLSIGRQICPTLRGWTFVAPRVVREYIARNPTSLSAGAGVVVLYALREKYPCPDRKGRVSGR